MSAIQAVVFDLDGVLIDSYELWFHLLNEAASHFGFPEIPRQRFHQTWGQGTEADIAAFFPGRTPDEMHAFYATRYRDFVQHVTTIPGALEALHAARGTHQSARLHRATACLTNSPGMLARMALEHVGLAWALDRVLGADEARHSKPHPGGLLKLCRQLRVSPETAVMIGDSPFDQQAARDAGTLFVGYKLEATHRIESLAGLRAWLERYEEQAGPRAPVGVKLRSL